MIKIKYFSTNIYLYQGESDGKKRIFIAYFIHEIAISVYVLNLVIEVSNGCRSIPEIFSPKRINEDLLSVKQSQCFRRREIN